MLLYLGLLGRKIEDKLLQFHMEMRPFHISVDVSAVHGNCERPACFSSWLVMFDHVLPTKGVSHRLPRSGHAGNTDSPNKVQKENVNVSWRGCFQSTGMFSTLAFIHNKRFAQQTLSQIHTSCLGSHSQKLSNSNSAVCQP